MKKLKSLFLISTFLSVMMIFQPICYGDHNITTEIANSYPEYNIQNEWDQSSWENIIDIGNGMNSQLGITTGVTDIFGMNNIDVDFAISIKIHLYCKKLYTQEYAKIECSFKVGDEPWVDIKSIFPSTEFEWHSVSWEDLTLPKELLDSLQIRLTVRIPYDEFQKVQLDVMYAEISYIPSKPEFDPQASDPLNFNFPREGMIYSDSMEGYYSATYGFEGDDDGSSPDGWVIEDNCGEIEVISELDGHSKILRLWDTIHLSGRSTRIYNEVSQINSGTIELWMRQDSLVDTDDRGHVSGFGNGNALFQVRMVGGSSPKWQARDGSSWVDITEAPVPIVDTWYHIRIDFEHTTNQYKRLGENQYYIHIGGEKFGSYQFYTNYQLEELHLYTNSYGGHYNVYFDAIGYSWDPHYDIEDNLPLTGRYPARYGFESDCVGLSPDGWVIDDDCGDIEVISELDGHKKVVRLWDTIHLSGRSTRIYNDVGQKDSGTIELWMRQDSLVDTDDRGHVSGFGNGNALFQVRMVGGSSPKWQARDGSSWVDITEAPVPIVDTWYHIRIDFEHTTNQYKGLGENQYYVHIDGVRYDPYQFYSNYQLEDLHLYTNSYGGHYNVYFDAIGYSWDFNYDIGDNIEIKDPYEGYYPSTFGFEDTKNYQVPHGWVDLSFGPTARFLVYPEMEGHKKVLGLSKTNNDYVQAEKTFNSPRSYGTIEFWFYSDYDYCDYYIILKSSDTELINIRYYEGDWLFKDGGSFYTIPGLTQIDFINYKWYHIQVMFNYQGIGVYYQGLENQWKIRIADGCSFDYSKDISLEGGNIDKLCIKTSEDPPMLQEIYLDAIGISWDPYYNIYDNLYEGLLIDVSKDSYDYMDYSLDGGVNRREIYGDTVIPMPKSGYYTLSLYGEAGSSNYYGEKTFGVDIIDKVGVFFYTSDSADGTSATYPFIKTHLVEEHIRNYKETLRLREGYTKIYIYNDVSSDLELDNIFDCLSEKRIDSQDEMFAYFCCHGEKVGDSSEIILSPFDRANFRKHDSEMFNQFNKIAYHATNNPDGTQRIGLLVESCNSGHFIVVFNIFPYLVFTSCKVDELANGLTSTGDPFYSHYFWSGINQGKNALEAHQYAYDSVQWWAYWEEFVQTPQKADNQPEGFIFFN